MAALDGLPPLRDVIQRHGLDAKKALGQNFLLDLNLTQKIVSERKLTTMMVTHSMRQALDYGHRTVMLHGGEIVLDVAGDSRKELQVEDLIAMFRRIRGQTLDDDALLIG